MLPSEPPSFPLKLQAVTCLRNGSTLIRDATIEFAPKTFTAITGDAGSNALLRVAGLLDAPDQGEVLVGSETIHGLSEQARAELRSRWFGYIFNAPYLLPSMTIVENVAVPLFKIAGASLDEARGRTTEVLEFAGLRGAEQINIGELTWEQQQRVALARGLVHGPAFLIVEHADSGMSPEESARLAELLRAVPARFGATVIAVFSNAFSPAAEDRVLMVEQGAVREDLATSSDHPSS